MSVPPSLNLKQRVGSCDWPCVSHWVLPNFLSPLIVGHTATHAVVMARLIIREEDHGIHPFIVQVRSLDDHHPLPGTLTMEGPLSFTCLIFGCFLTISRP